MSKKDFIKMEWVQFYVHLLHLAIGGLIVVLMSIYIDNVLENTGIYIVILIVLIASVFILLTFQIKRVLTYNKRFYEDPDVSIWKTYTTLVCYPLDLILYFVVLLTLI